MSYDPFSSPTSPLSDSFWLAPKARRRRALTDVQKQILRFLGTGGPSHIWTGARRTTCGERTGGRRVVDTTTSTLDGLVENKLVTYDLASRTYAANLEHPQVKRLLGFK